MKTKIYSLMGLGLITLAAMTSCSADDETGYLSNDLLRIANVNTEGVFVIQGSDSVAILQVKANGAWVLSCDDPTLTLLTTAGSGDGEATIRTGQNPSAEESRSWTVKLQSLAEKNAIVKPVTVTQTPNGADIKVTVADTHISWQAHTLTMLVESNCNWTVTLPDGGEWAVLKTPSGSGKGTIEIEMAKNADDQPRSFTVNVASTDGKVTKTLNMTQSEFGFFVELVGNKNIELPRAFDANGKDVQMKVNKNWTATVDQPWVNVSSIMGTVARNGEEEVQTVKIFATTNNSQDSRQANVVFTVRNTDNTIAATDTLHISQSGSMGLDLVAPAESFSSQAQTISVMVMTDLKWRAALTGTGATLKTTQGEGNGTIEIDLSANTTSDKRNFVLTVTSDDNSTRKEIHFSQSGNTYYINLLGTRAVSLPRTASSADVTIAFNQNWDATVTEPWLSIDPFMGEVSSVGTRQTQQVTISVVGNPLAEARTAQVIFTVRNTDGSVANTETLYVTQGSVNAPTAEQPQLFDITTNGAFVSSFYRGNQSQGYITEYGFFYGTSPDNLTHQQQIQFTPQAGEFGYEGQMEARLEKLQPLTTYYVVAYAVNAQGMGISQVQQFTTAGATPDEGDNNTPGY